MVILHPTFLVQDKMFRKFLKKDNFKSESTARNISDLINQINPQNFGFNLIQSYNVKVPLTQVMIFYMGNIWVIPKINHQGWKNILPSGTAREH